jgi:hypothetical protein
MAHTNTTRRRDSDSARERAAALRATQLRRERRRRIVIITSSVVAVLAVVAVIIVIGSSSKSGSTNSSASRTDASTSVVNAVTGVSGATLDSIGAGSATPPAAVKDAALASSGKPKVLYVGAEFCPYCAASRWALVQALSRFGTFSGLQITASASNDAFPNTSTFTFHGATYDSATISFVGRELQDRNRAELDTISSANAALWHRYTGQGSYPFLDIAGKYVEIGKTVDPALLGNLTADQIAQRLDTPSDPIAKAIDGQANVLTAAICQATNNAPAAVCTAPAVTVAAKALHG